jgi:hypothetical protein
MTAPRMRLAVATVLFVAWLGWLAYLAATDARPPVVSGPQLLAASAEVVAHVEAGPGGQLPQQITIDRVLRGEGLTAGQSIRVANLADSVGYAGPGLYLVPLAPLEGGPAGGEPAYRIPWPARSPGSESRAAAPLRALIYPWSEAVRKQYDEPRWR